MVLGTSSLFADKYCGSNGTCTLLHNKDTCYVCRCINRSNNHSDPCYKYYDQWVNGNGNGTWFPGSITLRISNHD